MTYYVLYDLKSENSAIYGPILENLEVWGHLFFFVFIIQLVYIITYKIFTWTFGVQFGTINWEAFNNLEQFKTEKNNL